MTIFRTNQRQDQVIANENFNSVQCRPRFYRALVFGPGLFQAISRFDYKPLISRDISTAEKPESRSCRLYDLIPV